MSFWLALGIEQTSNITTIRQAYAAKLKVTRPDVDAAAYQALHEAYQLAMKHAKSTPQVLLSEPVTDLSDPTGVATDTISEITQTSTSDSTDLLDPDSLVEQILEYYNKGGEQALMALWPSLEFKLFEIPLHQYDEYVIELVEMVVDTPKLSPLFINQLIIHFDWGNDFRLERILGKSLTQQLFERLRDVEFELRLDVKAKEIEQKNTNAIKNSAQKRSDDISQRYSHLAQFAKFSERTTQKRLNLCAVLVGPKLLSQWKKLDAEQCDVLQIDQAQKNYLEKILLQATHYRTRFVWFAVISLVCVQFFAYNNFHLIIMMLLLLTVIGAHHFQIADKLEKCRQWLYPTQQMNASFTQSVQTLGNSRIASIFFCVLALLFSSIETPVIGYNGAPFSTGYILFISFLLLLAWLTKPLRDESSQKISPAVFALCLYLVDDVGFHRTLQLLALSALLNSAAYATQIKPGGKILGVVWLLLSPIAFVKGMEGILVWLCFGLSWFLYEFAKRQSVGYSLGLIAFGVASFPHIETKFQVHWICIIAIVWVLTSMSMKWYATQMTQKY